MRLQQLERLRKKFNAFGASLDPFIAYLKDLEQKHVSVIVPESLSKSLRVPYQTALLMLAIAEKDHLLKKKFQVFSNNDHFPLGEFKDTNEIPDVIYNPATEQELTNDDYFVDVVFEVQA